MATSKEEDKFSYGHNVRIPQPQHVICTTWNAKGYNLYGRRFLEDFRRRWIGNFKLYVCPEGHAFKVDDYRIQTTLAPTELLAWKVKHQNNKAAHGIINGKKSFKYDAVRFANKVFFIIDMFYHLRTQNSFEDDMKYLTWMDGDIITHTPVTEEWFNRLRPADDEIATYLNRREWPECGFMMFNMNHPDIEKFMKYWKTIYESDAIFSYKEWHDSYVFGEMVKGWKMNGLKFNEIGNSNAPDGFHVFINSILGERFDHLKGARKYVGSSVGLDVVNPAMDDIEYWQKVKTVERDDAFLEQKKREEGLA